jgi:hypothetical protein
MKIYEFDAKMLTDGTHDWGFVEFPFDVQKEFGTKGQIKVVASFDGYEYRGSLAKMGHNCHFIGIRKNIRKAIGKNPGEMVHVTIKQDIEPRVIEVPEDLDLLLKDNPQAQEFFDSLSYTNRKSYVQWILSAKKEETRQVRLTASIEKLLQKIKEP